MLDQKIVQNTQIFPDTHYFIYKNKQYPIKYDYFKYSSKYFENNQIEIINSKYIQLIEPKLECELILSEKSIEDFINFVQGQKITLNNENVMELHFLSKKYEVNTLIDISKEYIKDHQQELLVEILSNQQFDFSFDTEILENYLIEHFLDYLDDEKLFNLNFSVIYRIFHKVDININDKQKIIDFLFKCLDKYGKQASILFYNINFDENEIHYLNRLLDEYSNIFDFHFINPTIISTIYNKESSLISKIISYEKKLKEQETIIQGFMNEINEVKKEHDKQISEIKLNEEKNKKQYEESINSIVQFTNELKSTIDKMKLEQIEQLNTQELKEKEFLKKYEENSIKATEEISQLRDEIKTLKSENNQFQVQLNEQKQKEKEFISKYEEDYKKATNEITQLNTDIKTLKSEKNKFQMQLSQKEKDNNELKNEILQMKNEINIIRSYEKLQKIDVKGFNKLDGEKQKDYINDIVKNNSINHINDFLNLLSNEFKESKNDQSELNFIILTSDSQNEDKFNDQEIGISYLATEILYDNNKINSPEFTNIINNFSKFNIEINYPSPKYNDIYQKVIDLTELYPNIVKISIFITGIESTDQNFHKNNKISYIKLNDDLKQITSINGEGSFEGCSLLTQISIPSTVSLLGESCFKNCSLLTEIEIPSSITSIEKNLFNGCSSLKQISIPSSVTSIKSFAFKGCYSLVKILIPSSVIEIENNAFSECTSLIQITIPSSVSKIGPAAFFGCKSLKNIEISSSLKTIENDLFNVCTSLTEISLPPSITSIKYNAFLKCKSLTKIFIPPSVKLLGSYIFQNCRSLTEVNIPKTVNSIKKYSFSKCSSLIQITIPSSVKIIEQYAFWKCSSLKNVLFEQPSSLVSIQKSAFSGCSSISQIEIPSSVTEVKINAFYGCSSLKQLSIPSTLNFDRIGIDRNFIIIRK